MGISLLNIAAQVHNLVLVVNLFSLTVTYTAAYVGECAHATTFAHNTPTRITIVYAITYYSIITQILISETTIY